MWQSPRSNLSSLKPYWQFRSLECFSNWITGLAIRSCFMLIPEAYHSFFEQFESLMYDFPVPILLAKWLHARTSAIAWKLRPHQLYPLTPQPTILTAARSCHPPRNRGSCCVMEITELLISEGLCLRVLPVKTYMAEQDSFSEPQVAHLWSVDRIIDPSVCGPRLVYLTQHPFNHLELAFCSTSKTIFHGLPCNKGTSHFPHLYTATQDVYTKSSGHTERTNLLTTEVAETSGSPEKPR